MSSVLSPPRSLPRSRPPLPRFRACPAENLRRHDSTKLAALEVAISDRGKVGMTREAVCVCETRAVVRVCVREREREGEREREEERNREREVHRGGRRMVNENRRRDGSDEGAVEEGGERRRQGWLGRQIRRLGQKLSGTALGQPE
eukprot:6202914-Pleurochrysis_carterae.AAC.2